MPNLKQAQRGILKKAISKASPRAGLANKFTPALNNITGKYPKGDKDKVKSLVFKAKPKWKPTNTPSNGIGVGP